MKQNEKKSGIKTGLIINFLSLISTVVLFEYYRYIDDWNLLPIIAVSSALFVFLISFYLVYGRTGAWRQTHRPFSKLDEREAGVIYESLRIAYSVFAILSLSILLVYAVGLWPVSIILFAAMLIIAHIMPASVMLWKYN